MSKEIRYYKSEVGKIGELGITGDKIEIEFTEFENHIDKFLSDELSKDSPEKKAKIKEEAIDQVKGCKRFIQIESTCYTAKMLPKRKNKPQL